GEVVAEVEAEKTTEEIYAPVSGVLQRILVLEGETVLVNETLALIAPTTESTVSRPATPALEITPRARGLAKELGIELSTVVGTGAISASVSLTRTVSPSR